MTPYLPVRSLRETESSLRSSPADKHTVAVLVGFGLGVALTVVEWQTMLLAGERIEAWLRGTLATKLAPRSRRLG